MPPASNPPRIPPFSWGDRLPTLTAERVCLRWLEATDIPALFAMQCDPEVMRYWSRPPMRDPREAEELLLDIRAHFERRSLFQWGIARLEDDQVVGSLTLHHMEPCHLRAEVGFSLQRQAWGRGLMTESLATAIQFAFGPLGLHRIEADADPRNVRSLRVLERAGFQREGLARERYRVGGEIQDSVLLGLLRTDWAGRHPTAHRSPPSPQDEPRLPQ